MPLSKPLVQRARELARLAHSDHVRKAGNVPYFTHLEGVAGILVEHGYDDEIQLAAAYLHDLIEDRPAFRAQLHTEMPREVVETVEALTEKKLDHAGRPRSKDARFDAYVAGLRAGTEAAERAAPISCADKIHNTRSLIAAEREGLGLLLKFSTRPGQHESQLATLRTVYAPRVSEALLATFDAAAAELVSLIDAWLPGRSVMLAAEAHLGQVDKGGAPYIHHPLRLMLAARTRDEQMVAVLHDVVEDTAWTLERLGREGFSPRVLRALDALTRRGQESYDAFIERIANDPLAARVKLLDLADNADLSRIASPTDEDRARVEKYRRATERLEAALRRRTLVITLDDSSRGALRRRAIHPVLRADHVTLAHRIDPDALDPAWIPGGARVGDRISFRAVREHQNAHVQAVRVEVDGTSVRPADDGVLHVTISREAGARSKDSNELVRETPGIPIDLSLRGVVGFLDD